MSWCQDDFSYQWNIFKADILGLGPLLILPAPIPSCLWIHCIQGPRPLSSDSLLPSQMLSSLSTSPLAVAGDGAKGLEDSSIQDLQVPARTSFHQLRRRERNQNQAESKGGAEPKSLILSFFFFNTKLSDPEPPYLKINLIIRLSSLCYQRTFYRMQLHLLF